LVELRGNVPTRIEKLDHGHYDAIVLAAAGVKRLGLQSRISSHLPLHRFLPAVSQGAIGVQIRSGDDRVARWVSALDHPSTRFATAAERAFLRTVEGGCHVPVGAFAEADGEDTLRLRAVVCSLDGSSAVEGETSGPAGNAGAMGIALARSLLERGGRAILEEIRKAGGGR
jgi:hydroxymethylbilane synthase